MRKLKIIGIVLAALALLIVVVISYIESRTGRMIEREFARLTQDRYRLTVADVDINPLDRSVTLYDIGITPNPAARADSAAHPAARPRMVDFSTRELLVAGIGIDRHGVKIGKLQLRGPRIKVRQTPRDGSAAAALKIAIDRIVVSEKYMEHDRIDTMRNVISGFAIDIEKPSEDASGGLAAAAPYVDLRLRIARITHMPDDESTRMQIDSVTLETAEQTIGIASFKITPTYSKEEFALKSWRHRDWSRISLSDISCRGVDFVRLVSSGRLYIDSAYLADGSVASYKDRNIYRTEWTKPMFHQVIQRFPLKFSLRTLAVGNLDARYEELKAGGDKPGVITIDRIGGRVDGLSNIPAEGGEYSEWRMHAMLMNAGLVSVVGRLPIDPLNDRFELSAALGRTDPTVFNDMIIPLGNVAVSGGTIDGMTFRIVGDSQSAVIDMTFLYDGLRVAMLGKQNGETTERTLLSMIVNRMVLIGSNPLRNKTRTAGQTVIRDPYRSPWNYIWRAIFAAAKETVGLGEL